MSTETMNYMNMDYILVADQQDDWRDHLTQTVETLGAPVRTAASSEDVLEMAITQPPALIVLDLMTREQGGFSVLARLQASPGTRRIPVIMVTAASKEIRSALGTLMNVTDVMSKEGFDASKLTARIASTLRMEAQRADASQPVASAS
jgi:two-component system alkaline phosphatase synthesis response regulator PhoP